jgi:hypothetical protein
MKKISCVVDKTALFEKYTSNEFPPQLVLTVLESTKVQLTVDD